MSLDPSGRTAPADRPKKGRYLSFDEIAKLIDAAEREHMRDLLILAIGTGARVGALCDIEGAYVHSDLGVINLMKWGELQTNKRNQDATCAKLLGQSLSARAFEREVAKVQVRVAVLNGFNGLGIPVAEAVG